MFIPSNFVLRSTMNISFLKFVDRNNQHPDIMIHHIDFEDSEIRYSDRGKGTAVVLLHGYLESLEIWNGFAGLLEDRFRVICPDLPGHGKSGVHGDVHSMDLLAKGVLEVIDNSEIDKCFIVGHSMGGYSGLAFMEHFPDRVSGLCLLHSHPFPDTKKTINNRCREIVLVNQGKKELISKINIPRAFASSNLERLKTEVDRATEIAISTTDGGITACLMGMMERPSRTQLLRETAVPVLFIAGMHDNYIPFEEVASKVELPVNGQFVALENSGHIGFIEEPEKTAGAITAFVENA
jgi:pimeloyl-ACP methyl ester carboxylesterase